MNESVAWQQRKSVIYIFIFIFRYSRWMHKLWQKLAATCWCMPHVIKEMFWQITFRCKIQFDQLFQQTFSNRPLSFIFHFYLTLFHCFINHDWSLVCTQWSEMCFKVKSFFFLKLSELRFKWKWLILVYNFVYVNESITCNEFLYKTV